jgi:hypothetical protein
VPFKIDACVWIRDSNRFDFLLQELDEGAGGAGAGTGAGEQIVEVTPSPGFDLETYISNYTGRTRANRLRFIALRVPSLQNDAFRFEMHLLLLSSCRSKLSELMSFHFLRMLLQEIKSGQNVQVLVLIVEMANLLAADYFYGLQLYRDTLELIGDKLGPAEQIRDNEWMEKTQVTRPTSDVPKNARRLSWRTMSSDLHFAAHRHFATIRKL